MVTKKSLEKYGFTPFSLHVVYCALSIPKGRVTTYGRIAKAAGGGSMSAQSVSGILWRASQKGVKDIPWHRIVYADGRIWLDEVSKKERLALHRKEGIIIDTKGKVVDFEKKLFEYT